MKQQEVINSLQSLQDYLKKDLEYQEEFHNKFMACLDNLQRCIATILMPIQPTAVILYPDLDNPETAHKNAKNFTIEVIDTSNKKDEVLALVKKYGDKISDIPFHKLEEFCDTLYSIELPMGTSIMKNGCPF